MSTVISCPHCSGKMSVAPQQAGTQVACPHCQKMFTAPSAAPVARPVAAAPNKPPVAKPVASAPRPPTAAPSSSAGPTVTTDAATNERLERYRKNKTSTAMTVVYIVGGVFAVMALLCCGGVWYGYDTFIGTPLRQQSAKDTAELKVATNMTKQVLAGNGYTGKFTVGLVETDGDKKIVTGNVKHQGKDQFYECTFAVRKAGNRSIWDILRVEVDFEEVYTKPPQVNVGG